MSKEALTVKLVLLGDSRVGKSSVVIRFVKNEFDQYKFPTIGGIFIFTKCITLVPHYALIDVAQKQFLMPNQHRKQPIFVYQTIDALTRNDVT